MSPETGYEGGVTIDEKAGGVDSFAVVVIEIEFDGDAVGDGGIAERAAGSRRWSLGRRLGG